MEPMTGIGQRLNPASPVARRKGRRRARGIASPPGSPGSEIQCYQTVADTGGAIGFTDVGGAGAGGRAAALRLVESGRPRQVDVSDSDAGELWLTAATPLVNPAAAVSEHVFVQSAASG